jgi:dihydrofolate reductase
MGKIFSAASVSVDGFIAGPEDTGFEHLFDWYNNGDVVAETTHPELTMRMGPQSAEYFRGLLEETGALVVGRHLFDLTSGWGGIHPLGTPVVVLSHSDRVPDDWPDDAPFTFVSEGIEAAVATAKELAGDKNVGLNAGTIVSQALDARLVDEIYIDLVPVVMGAGTSFFSDLAQRPVLLDGPLSIIEGDRVSHLRYVVRYT